MASRNHEEWFGAPSKANVRPCGTVMFKILGGKPWCPLRRRRLPLPPPRHSDRSVVIIMSLELAYVLALYSLHKSALAAFMARLMSRTGLELRRPG